MRATKLTRRGARWLLVLLLSACAAPPPLPVSAPTAGIDTNWYAQARRRGEQVLSIDTQRSLITIVVRRSGPFARLGHDHVVASRSISGLVAPGAGRADFQFRLDQLSVDEAELRRVAGLDSQPSADDIAGTRHNMLVKVLDAERYPLVSLHGERAGDAIVLTIHLHGMSRSLTVPTRIEREAHGLTASGSFALLQTDFGITPMSVLGGAIQVEDRMELQFRLVATER